MEESKNFSWTAPEYEQKEQTKDWYWALGVVVVAGSIASIIFKNYFFAILLILGGIMMAVFSIKKPETVPYELNQKGLKIKSRLYPYEKIKSFWVRKEEKPMLFIESERFFMPMISIHIDENIAETIQSIMRSHSVEEKEMKEHATERAMEYFGF